MDSGYSSQSKRVYGDSTQEANENQMEESNHGKHPPKKTGPSKWDMDEEVPEGIAMEIGQSIDYEVERNKEYEREERQRNQNYGDNRGDYGESRGNYGGKYQRENKDGGDYRGGYQGYKGGYGQRSYVSDSDKKKEFLQRQGYNENSKLTQDLLNEKRELPKSPNSFANDRPVYFRRAEDSTKRTEPEETKREPEAPSKLRQWNEQNSYRDKRVERDPHRPNKYYDQNNATDSKGFEYSRGGGGPSEGRKYDSKEAGSERQEKSNRDFDENQDRNRYFPDRKTNERNNRDKKEFNDYREYKDKPKNFQQREFEGRRGYGSDYPQQRDQRIRGDKYEKSSNENRSERSQKEHFEERKEGKESHESSHGTPSSVSNASSERHRYLNEEIHYQVHQKPKETMSSESPLLNETLAVTLDVVESKQIESSTHQQSQSKPPNPSQSFSLLKEISLEPPTKESLPQKPEAFSSSSASVATQKPILAPASISQSSHPLFEVLASQTAFIKAEKPLEESQAKGKQPPKEETQAHAAQDTPEAQHKSTHYLNPGSF